MTEQIIKLTKGEEIIKAKFGKGDMLSVYRKGYEGKKVNIIVMED